MGDVIGTVASITVYFLDPPADPPAPTCSWTMMDNQDWDYEALLCQLPASSNPNRESLPLHPSFPQLDDVNHPLSHHFTSDVPPPNAQVPALNYITQWDAMYNVNTGSYSSGSSHVNLH